MMDGGDTPARDIDGGTRVDAPDALQEPLCAFDAPAYDDEPSGHFTVLPSAVVAILTASATHRQVIVEAARDSGCLVGGAEVARTARVLVTDATDAPSERIRELRRLSRADAAIIALLADGPSWAHDAASARAAGAFACVRVPLDASEIADALASACTQQREPAPSAERPRLPEPGAPLSVLGRFTVGLLHELKNPLAVTEMNVNLLREDIAPLLAGRAHLRALLEAAPRERGAAMEDAAAFLADTAHLADTLAVSDDARSGLERIGQVLDRLAALAIVREQEPAPVDVASLATEARLAAAKELEGVAVEIVTEGALHAYAARPLADGILLNLVVNAAQAARALPHPRVRLHVYAAGERVVVSVRDNGPGIALDDQPRVFEPFFTTRRSAGALGLGLTICREYATLMRAQLSLWSMPGRGACFRLHMPRV